MSNTDAHKILKTIWSCKTQQQLFTAEEWLFRIIKDKNVLKFLVIKLYHQSKLVR